MFPNSSSVLWFRSTDQGYQWLTGYVELLSGNHTIQFEAIRGIGPNGFIALDDISTSAGPCAKQGNFIAKLFLFLNYIQWLTGFN